LWNDSFKKGVNVDFAQAEIFKRLSREVSTARTRSEYVDALRQYSNRLVDFLSVVDENLDDQSLLRFDAEVHERVYRFVFGSARNQAELDGVWTSMRSEGFEPAIHFYISKAIDLAGNTRDLFSNLWARFTVENEEDNAVVDEIRGKVVSRFTALGRALMPQLQSQIDSADSEENLRIIQERFNESVNMDDPNLSPMTAVVRDELRDQFRTMVANKEMGMHRSRLRRKAGYTTNEEKDCDIEDNNSGNDDGDSVRVADPASREYSSIDGPVIRIGAGFTNEWAIRVRRAVRNTAGTTVVDSDDEGWDEEE
jgi:hypothetical protein